MTEQKEKAPGGQEIDTTYDFGIIQSCRLIITNNFKEYEAWKNSGVIEVDFPLPDTNFYLIGIRPGK